MLTGLGHRTISSRYNQDCTVHLCSTGDHVLYVVGVSGAVNVCIVTLLGLVLNVSSRNRNTSFSLLRSLVDHVICFILCLTVQSQHLGDCCGQGRLTMVNVADRTNVNMGFASFKFFLCHFTFLLLNGI